MADVDQAVAAIIEDARSWLPRLAKAERSQADAIDWAPDEERLHFEGMVLIRIEWAQKRSTVEALNRTSADGRAHPAAIVPLELVEADGSYFYARWPGWHWCLVDPRGRAIDMEVPW